jgi:hypothetical protein
LVAALGYASGASADDGLAAVPPSAQSDARRALTDARNVVDHPLERALLLGARIESSTADDACRDVRLGTTGFRSEVRLRTFFGLPPRRITVCGRTADSRP